MAKKAPTQQAKNYKLLKFLKNTWKHFCTKVNKGVINNNFCKPYAYTSKPPLKKVMKKFGRLEKML